MSLTLPGELQREVARRSAKIDMVAIGCSAGGIEVLKNLLPQLPPGYRPTVVIVQHIAQQYNTSLGEFFSQLCRLPTKEAEDKEPIVSGKIYFAPAGYHLLIERNHCFALSVDPPVQFSRPSIDVMMESVAEIYAESVLGIVLTGSNSDGASGLRQIRQKGGLAVVQDPHEADFSMMPESALVASRTPYVLSSNQIGHLITGLK